MKRNILAVISVFLLACLVFTGCGGDKAKTAGGGGGTINISLHQDPPKLDPAFSVAFVERHVFQSIFDKLVDLNEKGEIVPMLAEKWTISPDGKKYTFVLRKDVKFHDGTPFNAEAVKFNFERYMENSSSRKNELKEVEKVLVINDNTIEIDLKKSFSPFLSILTDRAGMMCSPAAVKKYGDEFMNHPVGTGPYVFKERVKGSTITLEKNKDYWIKGSPKVDKLVYKIISDANVALLNLKSGQVDITNRFPLNDIGNYANDNKLAIINEPGQGFKGMALNNKIAPFDDQRVRKAISLLIDRETIVKVALSGVGTPGSTALPASNFAYSDTDKVVKSDVAKAKALLAEAGKADGFKFKIIIDTDPVSQQVGQLVQKMLKEANIEVELEKTDFGTLLEKARKGDYEAAFVGWSGRTDPDQNMFDWLVSGSRMNYMSYKSEEMDKLLNEARTVVDEQKRKDLYSKALNLCLEDSPYIYFYHEHNVFGISKSIKGFQANPDGMIRTVNLNK